MVQVLRSVYDAMIGHALDEHPNECCGLLGGTNGVITRIYRATNVAETKTVRYDVDSTELVKIFTSMRAADLEHLGIYHSHPRSPAEPSQTDINLATYPHWLYVIVSLAEPDGDVRAWWIHDGSVEEEELHVS